MRCYLLMKAEKADCDDCRPGACEILEALRLSRVETEAATKLRNVIQGCFDDAEAASVKLEARLERIGKWYDNTIHPDELHALLYEDDDGVERQIHYWDKVEAELGKLRGAIKEKCRQCRAEDSDPGSMCEGCPLKKTGGG